MMFFVKNNLVVKHRANCNSTVRKSQRWTRINHTVFPLCSRFLLSLNWLPQMLKTIRNQCKQNFEDEANNMQLDKEDIQWSNLNCKYLSITLVFLISWFCYLFLLCSISLLVKYDFILRYEAWVNALRVSSFIKNVPQISAKLIAFQRNLPRKLPANWPFFPIVFQRNWPRKFPRNWPFFPRICPWKTRYLPEALLHLTFLKESFEADFNMHTLIPSILLATHPHSIS